ncbi:N-acetyltransferase [Pseudolysobacter antarcticus]|uniref:N-acetyltransferase n=1 Tax=Pseudolysobacter antarcticus TaxID=2511995 RepID=A0A411HPY6_9GAMM|nr:N-acetyltransferase [Pseudolysobacter antarcticus]
MRFSRLDTRQHDRDGFCCGEPALDVYLRAQAGQHQRDGIATTHVLIDDAEPTRILGYCSLAAAQLRLHDLQPADRKRLPRYPVPAVRIGRLAVSSDSQGKGYGRLLVGHALNCSVDLRARLGIRLLLVDAKNDAAASFYRSFGFQSSADDALTLYLSLGNG